MSLVGAVRALRQLAGPSCDLCGGSLEEPHDHLFLPAGRKLCCCCSSCATHSPQRQPDWLPVGRGVSRVGLVMDDALWDSLGLPVELATFWRTSSETFVASYPSPAGATECTLPLAGFAELRRRNPSLDRLRPQVEALVVYRPSRAWIVPIDEHFRLVGLMRTHWRGFSGGDELWAAVEECLARWDRG